MALEEKITDWSEYWNDRWARGATGWHQAAVEPSLITYFGKLGPRRIFVPLCGKSRDLAWLASRGHEVVGVELSEQATSEFFRDNEVSVQICQTGSFKIFSAGRIKIFCGNIFDLTTEFLGKFDAVYDRAALVALPPVLRPRYARKIIELVKQGTDPKKFIMLQLTLRKVPDDGSGPPFSIDLKELENLYGDDFKLELKSEEDESDRGQSQRVVTEVVHIFTI